MAGLAEGRPEPRLYMRNLVVLVVESNPQEQEIVAQILAGFKVKRTDKRGSAAEAMNHLGRERADLIIVGAALPEVDGYAFIAQLRRAKAVASRDVPVLLLSGHTRAADVCRARDCGANWVLVRPVTSAALYQRIAWLARNERPFVDAEAYAGPDRRFRNAAPPPDTTGRRKGDLSLKVGEATSSNMSQADIDALLNGKGPIQ